MRRRSESRLRHERFSAAEKESARERRFDSESEIVTLLDENTIWGSLVIKITHISRKLFYLFTKIYLGYEWKSFLGGKYLSALMTTNLHFPSPFVISSLL